MKTSKRFGQEFDWAAVHTRMELARRAIAGEAVASPETDRRILEDRARLLAQPLARPEQGDQLELLTFALANEQFAVESRYVREVFRLRGLSPLPGAQSPVFGVTAWRGSLLVVLDLRGMLGLPVAALNDLSRVVVVGEGQAVGILVDAVEDLITCPASEVREPPHGVAANREYLRGITGDAVLVLDAALVIRRHA